MTHKSAIFESNRLRLSQQLPSELKWQLIIGRCQKINKVASWVDRRLSTASVERIWFVSLQICCHSECRCSGKKDRSSLRTSLSSLNDTLTSSSLRHRLQHSCDAVDRRPTGSDSVVPDGLWSPHFKSIKISVTFLFFIKLPRSMDVKGKHFNEQNKRHLKCCSIRSLYY